MRARQPGGCEVPDCPRRWDGGVGLLLRLCRECRADLAAMTARAADARKPPPPTPYTPRVCRVDTDRRKTGGHD